MQSIFRYPGGKTRKSIRQKILNVAPVSFEEYREPFVGGGGIFFDIPVEKKRWINDFDRHLVSVYLALRDRPDDFISICREILPPQENEELTSARPGGRKIYNKRLKEIFDQLLKSTDCDPALKYYFVNRTNWAGRVNYDLPSRCYFSNPNGWRITQTDKLKNAGDILQGVRITTQDFSILLQEPGNNVWIYCDPPYVVNTDFSKATQLYKHNFSQKDHERLAEEVYACEHQVCLSYDDCDLVRSLYGDNKFTIIKEEWKYCGTSSASDQKTKTKRTGQEVLIINY